MLPTLYTAAWIAFGAVALGLLITGRAGRRLRAPAFWRWLLRPWKVACALLGWAGLVLLAPYTGDPTWDAVDGTFMPLLTFATAPWAVGTLYRAIRGERSAADVALAVWLWLFSASWSYDAWLWWRDGAYPVTWLSNLAASSGLYLGGGLLWSLTWREGVGVTFAFRLEGWPDPEAEPGLGRLWVWVAVIAAPIGVSLVLFVVWNALLSS